MAPPPLSPLMEQTPLQRVESQFYEYTSHEELSKELKISSQASTLIYNYWKLKRKVREREGGREREITCIVLQVTCTCTVYMYVYINVSENVLMYM